MAIGRPLRFAGFELVLWTSLYAAYLALRGVAIAAPEEALRNASSLIHVERAAGVFHELQVQRFVADVHLEDFFDAYYLVGFGPLIVSVLVILGVRRPDAYRRLRTWLLVSLAIASIGYLLLPTAPPRLVPHLGIADTVGLSGHDAGSVGGIPFNPYAAMPSMHVGWSLLVAIVVFQVTRRRLTRALFGLHPLLMAVTVTATGNHYFADELVGALVALAAIGIVALHLPSRIGSFLAHRRFEPRRPCLDC
jgi:hypothetical protein